MLITKTILTEKILAFLNSEISTEEFAVWAENTMLESDYEEDYFDTISYTLHKVGVMNVKSFEIKISYFLNILVKLDYLPTFGTKQKAKQTTNVIYA